MMAKRGDGLLAGEMVPAVWTQRLPVPRRVEESEPARRDDFADAGEGHAAEASRDARNARPGNSEQEFVILAAVERAAEVSEALAMRRGATRAGKSSRNNRERRSVNDGANTAGRAQTCEIRRESIGQVHGGRSEPFGGKPRAEGQARVRVEVAPQRVRACGVGQDMPAFVSQQFESGLGRAQTARDVDGIPRRGAAARQHLAAAGFTDYGDGRDDVRVARHVAANQADGEAPGSTRHAASKGIEPAACSVCGERERQEEEARSGAHGGEVAYGAGQGFVANGVRRMQGSKKMSAFNKRIGAQHPLAAAARSHHRGVVPNAQGDSGNWPHTNATGDDAVEAGDERSFVWHERSPHTAPQHSARAPKDFHRKRKLESPALVVHMREYKGSILLDFAISGSLHSFRFFSQSRESGIRESDQRQLRGQRAVIQRRRF